MIRTDGFFATLKEIDQCKKNMVEQSVSLQNELKKIRTEFNKGYTTGDILKDYLLYKNGEVTDIEYKSLVKIHTSISNHVGELAIFETTSLDKFVDFFVAKIKSNEILDLENICLSIDSDKFAQLSLNGWVLFRGPLHIKDIYRSAYTPHAQRLARLGLYSGEDAVKYILAQVLDDPMEHYKMLKEKFDNE
ncbi:hypothetical protein JXM83_02260 [Candidatus Woesearchaeota archaeon]|nr:hypothetical protein [Candidatus Woesearchaeota archaeon]